MGLLPCRDRWVALAPPGAALVLFLVGCEAMNPTIKVSPVILTSGGVGEVCYCGGASGATVTLILTFELTDGSFISRRVQILLTQSGDGCQDFSVPNNGDTYLFEDKSGTAPDASGLII